MPVDINAAEWFVLANARLLDRHRLAVLLHGAPVAPVLAALRAYRNGDGGFGHALEPDIRAPESEPALKQVLEWRGIMTLWALTKLRAHGRIELPS